MATNKIVILDNSVELYEHYINDQKWERTLSFKRGGVTYLISNGTIKFYAYIDYLYRNCLMSMQLPLYIVDEKRFIDGEYSDIEEITELLDPIFPSNDIDAELDYYLTKTEAAETYQPIGDYLTKTSADTLYQPIGDYVTDEELAEVLDDYYTKDETSGASEIQDALDEKLDASAYTPCDLSNYYTKDESDARFQPIGDYLTSADTYTREEIDDKLDDKQDKLIAGENITISGNVISAAGGSGGTVDAYTKEEADDRFQPKGDYVTFNDLPDVYTKEEINNLFVTKQYFTANTITKQTFITTIYNIYEEINSLKNAISECCGTTGETEYRWIVVPNDYTCSGTTKMTKEKQQSSTDGIHWTDTGQYRTGSTVLEYNSQDCGYSPVVSYKVEMRYNDGSEDNRQCDGSGVLRWLNPSNWQNITGATVGQCVDTIGNLCFNGFSGLTNVSIPDTVISINTMAFGTCVSLPSIDIPTGVTSIGDMAFFQCTSLESIVIPSGVTSIEYATLSQCSAITSITLSDSLVTIGIDAMSHCSSLPSITIPSGVTYIDEYAFKFDTSLTSVTCLAVTPPTINGSIFYGCHNLSAIYVPAGSVNAFKASWTEYADKIRAIS